MLTLEKASLVPGISCEADHERDTRVFSNAQHDWFQRMKPEAVTMITASQSSKPTSASVCAVIVAYFPDAGFEARVKGLLSQVGTLVVVDNTPAGTAQPRLTGLNENQIHIIENHANLGVAAALNQGLAHAFHLGCKWTLTLDQDTQCYPNMVATLLAVYDACQPKPAVIGSNYFDRQNKRLLVRNGSKGDHQECKTVITSGSLINTELASEIGGFREEYFIDQVDHEFCLRMRAHGHRVVISLTPTMEHSVGSANGARIPFLGTLPNHPPLRKYYIARNTVVTVAEYWRREPEWCLRRLMRLLLGLGEMALLEEHRFHKVRAFAGGVTDGLRRRMGPCQRESISHSRPYAS